ncbi:MAG: Xaa-Pro dipeptidase [Candidatus Marinimicrobia bacterium]|nr:Xaa-Pro dipeptidase [Candidatus Neomarinimicrobiota bacterium]
MRKLPLVLALFIQFTITDLAASSIILQPKNILDVDDGTLYESQILIEDGIIVEIGKNISKRNKDIETLELSELTIMPGLMDSHVHLIGNTELKGYESIGESSYLSTIYGVINAKKTLLSGFTTVRNVGAGNFADVALKQAINRNAILGPTMFVSGPALGITGGHCDSNILPFDYKYTSQGVADGPWEVRKKVRLNRKYGADLIKFCGTGGVMSKNTDVNAKQYTLEEMQAIVDEAHNHGMKVATHAHGLIGIKTAIIAGVDSIEHASFIDNETIELAKEKGTFLSMDIYVSDYILGEGAAKGILEESLEKERSVGRFQRQNFQKAVKASAKITFGTDAGIYPHGKNARQFKYMVEWGMTSLQAIQAATINTAELFGLSNTGMIKKNYEADIIGVKGNPLKDITILENVSFVMKDGIIVKP